MNPTDIPAELPTEPKAKLSRKVLIVGSAALGALSVLVLQKLASKPSADIIVIDSTPEPDAS